MCSHGAVSPCFSRTPRHSEAATIARRADLPTVSQAVIRDRTREGRDGDATAGAALRFVEVFAVVRQ